ncbi:MAG: ribose-phosphate pyrophosphokinase-like domain-containing protein [Deltaproteobacteria bacterium]|nr:ribose-phosphate pyrophosphokinase-like domain-containing protein [Deltaproteobacteria bacterium]
MKIKSSDPLLGAGADIRLDASARARLERMVAELRGAGSLDAIGHSLRAIAGTIPRDGAGSIRETLDAAGAWLSSVFGAAQSALRSGPTGLRPVLAEADPAAVKLFCGVASPPEVETLAKELGLSIGKKDFKIFSTGDPFTYLGTPPNKAKGVKAAPEDVAGRTVYVVQGNAGDAGYDLPTLVAEALQVAYAAVENGAKKAILILPESLNPATHLDDPFAALVNRLAIATGIAPADIRYARELDRSGGDALTSAKLRAGLARLGPKTKDAERALDLLGGAKDLGQIQKAIGELDLAIAGLSGQYPEAAQAFARDVADLLAVRLAGLVPGFGDNALLLSPSHTVVLAGQSNPELSEGLARSLGASYGKSRLSYDGEGRPRVDFGVPVRDRKVVLLQTTRQDPATAPEARHSTMGLLAEALLLFRSAVDRGASDVTLVLPYMPNARSDKADQKGVGAYAAMVARWVTAVADDAQKVIDARARRQGGAEGIRPRVVLVEPHDPHNPHFFGTPVRVISGANVLARKVIEDQGREGLVIVAPDQGAVKRTAKTAEEVDLQMVEGSKSRSDNEEKATVKSLGDKSDIEGKKVLVIDDEIATGGTMRQTVAMLKKDGAAQVHVAVSHANMPVEIEPRLDAIRKLRDAGADSLYLLDTQPVGAMPADLASFVHVVSVADTIAKEAI